MKYKDGHLYSESGRKLGGVDASNGYVRTRVSGVLLYAHRIIWEMHHGAIPKGMDVDHVNANRTDNRIGNLQLLTRAENSQKGVLQTRWSGNTSGFTGVYLCKSTGKWRAEIIVSGVKYRLGRFATKGLAAAARVKAELKMIPHFELYKTKA